MMQHDRFSARVLGAFGAAGLPSTLSVRAAAAGAPAEILLYDEIGPWGITGKDFARALADAGEGDLVVRINSPGGDVFHGMSIYNQIQAHPAPTVCVVDGLAASAASLVAMACGSLEMAEASVMMVHNCWTFAVGNRHALAAEIPRLELVDKRMTAIYSARSGKTPEDIASMMDAETWLAPADAIDAGLADRMVAAPQKQARARAAAVAGYAARAAARAAFLAALEPADGKPEPGAPPEAEEGEAGARLARARKRLRLARCG